MERQKRIELIDGARGLSIILMIFYHFFYDLAVFCAFPSWIVYNPLFNFLQPVFAGLFILMSGASAMFSRSNVKRGLKMLAGGLAISLVTWLFDPSLFVRFGILHFMGVAALLFAALRPLITKIPYQQYLWPVLFFLCYFALDRTFDVKYLAFLGFRSPGYASSDYFPVLPWIFVYFMGAWLGARIKAGRMPQWFYETRAPFFAAVGRHTLWIYLLHQPILMGLTYLIRYFQSVSAVFFF